MRRRSGAVAVAPPPTRWAAYSRRSSDALYMYMHIHIYIHICIYIDIYIYIHMYICIYMYIDLVHR